MINQTQWRSYFLAVTSIGTNLAVVYTLIVSTVGNRPVADFEFPEHLSLNLGQVIAVKSGLSKHETNKNELEAIKAHKKYQYTKYQTEISLEMGYLVGTRGDVGTYLHKYTSIAPEIIKTRQVKHLEGVGYHALFNSEDRAYLSSCISPRSLSNVTQQQFSQHRYQNDLELQVGLDWLRGKASIRDRRCLWVLLSTPITLSNTQAAYQILETTWIDLYQWWLPNFPNLTTDN